MILAINTSTMQFSLALMEVQGNILSEHLISPGAKNFNGFMPAVHSLFASSKAEMNDVEAIAVAVGPGSFTGLRVGLAFAKGMAQGLQIPIIGVSSLEAMAAQLPFADRPVCSMITSRKGEIFIATFSWSDEREMVRTSEDIALRMEEITSVITGPTYFLGNDFSGQGREMERLLGDMAILAPLHLWSLRASAVGTLGLKRFIDHEFDDLQALVPSYLRPPDIRPSPYSPLSDKKNAPISE